MRQIRSRRALITGAASGIGRAIALALADEGARLCLVDIDATGLAQTAEIIRSATPLADVTCETCDLSKPGEIDALVLRVRQNWGTPHILINNAGIAHYGSTRHMTRAQWEGLLDVNLLAPVRIIHAFLPDMLRLDSGHIVNMSSVFGLVPYRKIAAYQASKFAIVGLSQSLRVELGGTPVSVSVICPGFVSDARLTATMSVADPAHRARSVPRWLCCTSERVAAATVRAIRRDRAIVIVTPLARVLWLAHRVLPRLTLGVLRFAWGWSRRRHA